MKLSQEIKKMLDEANEGKFKTGNKVKIIKGGYAGLHGKIVNEPLNYKGKYITMLKFLVEKQQDSDNLIILVGKVKQIFMAKKVGIKK